MSLFLPMRRTEVLLLLQDRAKAALDYYNTENSTSYPIQWSNVKFKTPADGGAYVRFKVNFGTTANKLTSTTSNQAGVCIVKVNTPLGGGEFPALGILDAFENHFDNLTWPEYSVKINGFAGGQEAAAEGEYWTQRAFIYFDYTKKGIQPNG
jgi:hypothetical protein